MRIRIHNSGILTFKAAERAKKQCCGSGSGRIRNFQQDPEPGTEPVKINPDLDPVPDPQHAKKDISCTYLTEQVGDFAPHVCFEHVGGHVPVMQDFSKLATISFQDDLVKSFPLSFGKPLRHRPPWYFGLGPVATNYMKKKAF